MLPSIIYHSVLEWEFIFQRPQQLLREMGRRGWRVVFVEPRRARQMGETKATGTVEAAPNVFVCREAGEAAALGGPAPVLWVAYPPFVRLLRRYRPRLVIYDAVDLPAGEFATWAPYVPELLAAADIVFAASPELAHRNAEKHPNVHLLPNGADYEHFARAVTEELPAPEDVRDIRRPLVGFCGTLAGWLDWELLTGTAALLPDYSFVFIGPPLLGKKAGELPRRSNMHYLGHRQYSELPAYFACFAAALLPFRVNPVTRSSDPVKVYEYLAAGLPVVATPLPAVGRFPGVRTAQTPAEFARQLRQAVEGDSPAARAARRKSVRRETWETRAAAAQAALTAALSQKSNKT
ncbi:MAG: glycosyltransferase [bacterium]